MNKLNVVYLHVGADKTGSTTIQKFLHTNRNVLKSYGYCYPSLMTGNQDDISSTYSHHLVGAYFAHNLLDHDYYRVRYSISSEEDERSKANRYMDILAQDLRKGSYNALILSYEGLYSLKTNELQELKAYLLNIAEAVKIIYYLRPRFSYGLSALSQRISMGAPSWKHHPPVNYYRHRLLTMESVFGKENLLVRRFSKDDFRDGDLISDFCYATGLDQSFLKEAHPVQPSNASLSELAIRVGDALVFLLGRVDGPKGIEFYKLFYNELKSLGGRPYRFNELQNKILFLATKEDSLFVRNNYGIELNDAPTECDNRCPVIKNEAAEAFARYLVRTRLPNFNLTDEKYVPVAERCIRLPLGCLRILAHQVSNDDAQQRMAVTVQIENNSLDFWGGDLLPVNLSYRWFNDRNKEETHIDSVRTPLPGGGISPGEVKGVVMSVLLPEKDGDYRLRLSMVQEYCDWFDDIGFKAQVVDVKIAGGRVIAVTPRICAF